MNLHRPLIALALVASSAAAQNGTEGDTLLGAGIRNRPTYDGASERTTEVVPVVRYHGGPFFVRTTYGFLEGGARVSAGGLAAGVQVAYERGPRDVDPGASVGAHVEWTTKIGPAPVIAIGRFRNHVDSERGREFDARLTVGVYGTDRTRAGIFGQATWSSDKHMRTYYEVEGSGLLYTSLGALGSYDLGRDWRLVGFAEWRRLADKPAQSAFVTDRTGSYVMVGGAYRF